MKKALHVTAKTVHSKAFFTQPPGRDPWTAAKMGEEGRLVRDNQDEQRARSRRREEAVLSWYTVASE